MSSLEDYLLSDYLVHRQDMTSLTANLSEAVEMLIKSSGEKGWPYQWSNSSKDKPAPEISHGTMAMVITALGRAGGFCTTTSGAVRRLVSIEQADTLIRKNLVSLAADVKSSSAGANIVPTSKTFGPGNPVTLSHLVDLLASFKPNRALAEVGDLEIDQMRRSLDDLKSSLGAAADKLETIVENGFVGEQNDIIQSPDTAYYKNAFVPLRAIRASIGLRELEQVSNFEENRVHLRSFFEATLHEQLSFSAIPDSRFDAAELVFSLEGLVHCAKEAIDSTLFCRVIEVLGEKQNTSAHWRPSKPFLAAQTGAIFLPLSVEVANSLMQSISIMDEGRTHDTYTSLSLPLLKRFWNWLQARTVKVKIEKGHCVGWHSEHINAPHLVHPWDTSLVIEFMVNYHELLEREIQNTTLKLSGLQWVRPVNQGEKDTVAEWKKVIDQMDPSIGGPIEHQVYHRIGEDFVQGWHDGKPTNYSMMLYGPPGTGKTSVAEKLSEHLRMPLITVTVSDFLGSGGANVESRAKAIFETLQHQQNSIILFDEIDSFLLDRDSKFYAKQDSLFQFLTPGMLTKFNNLRRAKKCIFIIATNYDNRIDPAIKRTGRIDKRYLLPLPDTERRKRTLMANGLSPDGYTAELEQASVMFGYGDLVNAIKTAGKETEQVLDYLASAPRATSFQAYLRRRKSNKSDFPVEEFLDLVRLAEDAKGSEELKKLHADEKLKHLSSDIRDRVKMIC